MRNPTLVTFTTELIAFSLCLIFARAEEQQQAEQADEAIAEEAVQLKSGWNLYLTLFIVIAVGVSILLLEHYGSILYKIINQRMKNLKDLPFLRLQQELQG